MTQGEEFKERRGEPSFASLCKVLGVDTPGFLSCYTLGRRHRFEYPAKFDTLATRNFSSWEDVRKTLVVEPAVIARLKDSDRTGRETWRLPRRI